VSNQVVAEVPYLGRCPGHDVRARLGTSHELRPGLRQHWRLDEPVPQRGCFVGEPAPQGAEGVAGGVSGVTDGVSGATLR
jgi:hypothetical protein